MESHDRWSHAEFLQRESHQLESAMRGLQSHLITVLFGSLTIGAVSVAALVEYSKFDVILAVPVILPLAWLTGTRLLAELFAIAAQRRAVENSISDILQEIGSDAGFRAWEAEGGRAVVRGLPNLILFSWFVTISTGLGVICVVTAWNHDAATMYVWMALGVFVAGGIASVTSGISAVRVFNRIPERFPPR